MFAKSTSVCQRVSTCVSTSEGSIRLVHLSMLLLLLLPLPLLRSLECILSPAFFSALIFFKNPCLFSFLKERESFPQYEYVL